MAENKKKRFVPSIGIPNCIITNEGFSLDAIDFVLYATLRYYSYLQKSNTVNISHAYLMAQAHIRNGRTFKKSIDSLYLNKLVENSIEVLPNRGNVEIKLANIDLSKFFTLLPVKFLSQVDKIGHLGYRMMYYYTKDVSPVSFRDGVSDKHSWKSIDTICVNLNVSVPSVIKYNSILEEHGFIGVTRHVSEFKGYYQETGKKMFHRNNNQYYLLENEMWKSGR